MFCLWIDTSYGEAQKPEYNDQSFQKILSWVIPKEEEISKHYILAWSKYIQKDNMPRAQDALIFIETNKNNEKRYYLIVMGRMLNREPRSWSIDYIIREFGEFKPYRKYNKIPTNKEIDDLLKYSRWDWEGKRCRFGIIGGVDEELWEKVIGVQPQHKFSNKGYQCN